MHVHVEFARHRRSSGSFNCTTMLIQWCVSLTYFFVVNSSMLSLPDEFTTRASLSECVVLSADEFTDFGNTISVSISVSKPRNDVPSIVPLDHILIKELNRRNLWKLVVRKAKDFGTNAITNGVMIVNVYIIQIRDLWEIQVILKDLSEDASWNPLAKFLIVSASLQYNMAALLQDIVRYLWRYNVTNVAMLFVDDMDHNVYNVYTWFPYFNGGCGFDTSVKLIDSCSFGITKKGKWFLDKVPHKVNGCRLVVKTTIIPPFVMPPVNNELSNGLEIQLLNMVAEIANFSLIYLISDVADNVEIGTPSQTNESDFNLHDKKIDIIIGNVVPDVNTYINFDVVTSYFQDSLILCVPHATRKKDWLKVLKLRNVPAIIVCLFLHFSIATVTCALAKFAKNERASYKSFVNTYFNYFMLLLANPLWFPPRTSTIRLLTIIWIVFSLHTQTMYTSELVSSLTRYEYSYQIKNLQELTKDKYQMYMFPLCKRYLNMSDETQFMKLSICESADKCLSHTARDENTVTCAPGLYIRYYMNNFVTPEGDPQLYCFSDNVVSYPIEMLMWKGFPLRERLDELVTRIKMAGFLYKWEKDALDKTVAAKPHVHQEAMVLKFVHLEGVFIIVGIEHTISVLVFIIELLYRKKLFKIYGRN